MIQQHQAVDTFLTADSVEWCRHDDYKDLLACGTYQLNTATRERVGNVQLYRLSHSQEWYDRAPPRLSTTNVVSNQDLSF